MISIIRNLGIIKDNLKKRLPRLDVITDFGSSFSFDKISVFNNLVLIKAKDEKEAKIIYSKYIGN